MNTTLNHAPSHAVRCLSMTVEEYKRQRCLQDNVASSDEDSIFSDDEREKPRKTHVQPMQVSMEESNERIDDEDSELELQTIDSSTTKKSRNKRPAMRGYGFPPSKHDTKLSWDEMEKSFGETKTLPVSETFSFHPACCEIWADNL